MASSEAATAPPAAKRQRRGWDNDEDPYKNADGAVVIPAAAELQSVVKALQMDLMNVSTDTTSTPA